MKTFANHLKVTIVILSFFIAGIDSALGSKEAPLDGICTSVTRSLEKDKDGKEFINAPKRFSDEMEDVIFVGKGQFGSVHVGKHEGKPIAIKSMKKMSSNYWEVKAIHDMRRGNDVVEGIPDFIACEIGSENIYLYTQALHKDMEKMGKLPGKKEMTLKKRLRLYSDLAETLQGIHEHNLVHRDIKPANMMSDSEEINRIYIIDFGFTQPEKASLKAGSQWYYSPELVNLPYSHVHNADDDDWALALSIIELEFGSDKPYPSSFKSCARDYFASTCHKDFVES